MTMAENKQKLTNVSPKWTRPDEVMKLFRLKMKKRKLQARMMNRTHSAPVLSDNIHPITSSSGHSHLVLPIEKRKNSFRSNLMKKPCQEEPVYCVESASSDNTLFNLLNLHSAPEEDIIQYPVSFSSIFTQASEENETSTPVSSGRPLGKSYIPVDWSLKTNVRFTSPQPFAWNQNLRTSEEASGITGFVRCLSTEAELDTSPNARFHQCCLVWQHPALPWLTLFPRSSRKAADSSIISTEPKLKAALMEEFIESFRSLFQLVRARQCPYFYVCANAFTCLFRAAGVCGHTDVNAMLTPTTRGFRHLLKQEDVVYTMPLWRSRQSGDASQLGAGLEEEEEEEEDEEGEEGWLESIGMAKEDIKRLNKKQAKLQFDSERTVDRTPESLVYVEGVEAQAMFNFLMNCKSLVAQTGALAGVSPTLLAPVAFHGATLKPLKTQQSLVKQGSSTYHSMKLTGPILPHTLHNLCSLLDKSLDEFSAASDSMESTRPFTAAARVALTSQTEPEAVVFSPSKAPAAFNKVNLSDCGLQPVVLERFCSDDVDRVIDIDSLKFNLDRTYSWE